GSGRSPSVGRRRRAASTAGRSASSSSTLHAKPATYAARRRVSTSNTSFIARSLTRYAGDRKAALVIGRRTAWLIVLIVLVALVAVGVAVFNFAPEIVRHVAVLRLESLLHRRVSIHRLDLNLLTRHTVGRRPHVGDRVD